MQDYTAYKTLAEDLPPLVRKQRRLEAEIVPLAVLQEDEKAVRAAIDRLLLAAGVEAVTCLGYDVRHVARKGTERLNQDALVAALEGAGVDRSLVIDLIAASTETGDPSSWATVKPSKGSKVRV